MWRYEYCEGKIIRKTKRHLNKIIIIIMIMEYVKRCLVGTRKRVCKRHSTAAVVGGGDASTVLSTLTVNAVFPKTKLEPVVDHQ